MQLPDINSINLTNAVQVPPGLSNPTYTIVNGQLSLTYDFDRTIQGSNITITLNPSVEFPYGGYIVVPVVPTNNMPAIKIDDDMYHS